MAELWRYSYRQIQHIPYEYLIGAAFVVIIGIIVSFWWNGVKTGLRYSSGLVLTAYVFLIFCSTVILRKVGKIQRYDFHPFWSYKRPDLLVENIMNVVVFIPVDFLFRFCLQTNDMVESPVDWMWYLCSYRGSPILLKERFFESG